jgi:hypothetical protein
MRVITASGRKTQLTVGVSRGRVRVRLGQQTDLRRLHGSRGRTRAVELEPRVAAQLVEQLAKAIAKALAPTGR